MINLINSNTFNKNSLFKTDILIIGSGINCLSFIDFFHSLNKTNLKSKITIIEKGETNKDLQKKNRNELSFSTNNEAIINDGFLKFDEKGMNQSVGGNSLFWGGRFAKLDKEDFLQRDWLEGDKQWPIDFNEYNNVITKVFNYYEVNNLSKFDLYNQFSNKHLISSKNLENKIFQIKYINFYEHLSKKIKNQNEVDIYFNAELDSFNFDNQKISYLTIKNKNSETFKIKAKTIILSAGVIGNIKNLLKQKIKSNLIDSKKIIGKFIMNHPGGRILDLQIKNKPFSSMYFGSNFLFSSYRYGLKGSLDFQKQNSLTNSLLLFQPFCHINKSNLKDFPSWIKRKFFGSFDKKIIVNLYLEMLPNINNKIHLVNNTLKIDVNIDKHAYRNIDFLIRELLKYFSYEKKLINQIIDNIYSKNNFQDTYHYMGGTIMGKDKSQSVVDENLKHHEIDNLYILGASTFPRSGNANPVATQLFLSYRLACHLLKI